MIYNGGVYPAFGTEKIELEIAEHNRAAKESVGKLSNALIGLGNLAGQHEKESDWAIAGGLASGIGGVGTGIAAAGQTQINNMEVRARNAQRDAAAAQYYSLANQAKGLKGPALLNGDSDFKVCIKQSINDLFKKLRIYADKVKWGTTTIHFSLDDSAPAWIDGYVIMKVCNPDGEVYDEQVIPVPFWGERRFAELVVHNVPEDTSTKGMKNKTYGHLGTEAASLKFEPMVLWELDVTNNPDYHYARKISDLPDTPDKQRFLHEWENNQNKLEERAKAKKRKTLFSVLAGLGIAAAVIGLMIAFLTK